ncbi:reverse transcriptase [Plakobranchus ocellatus]|uniref:Reverse transcriptase n=1 Tax=Plakobranchus ocellatus TaxID=259542 RepID=A0AAV4A8G8_9GAST|nr:reverse transcriptase [Plakobranchus ocellatus]
MYCRKTKLKLQMKSILEEYKCGKARLLTMLEESDDPVVKTVQPSLKTGRKWKVTEAVDEAKECLKMKETCSNKFLCPYAYVTSECLVILTHEGNSDRPNFLMVFLRTDDFKTHSSKEIVPSPRIESIPSNGPRYSMDCRSGISSWAGNPN